VTAITVLTWSAHFLRNDAQRPQVTPHRLPDQRWHAPDQLERGSSGNSRPMPPVSDSPRPEQRATAARTASAVRAAGARQLSEAELHSGH
jgi:hypothetical protein